MANQYIGEIRYFTYLRGAPSGWQACDGSLLPISQYDTLYALLGTTYGGDGSSTFGVPDLRGRLAIGAGAGNPLGQTSGTETVSLNGNQIPTHTHAIQASLNTAGNPGTDPTNQVFANGPELYAIGTNITAMASNAIGMTGQGLAHENCGPTQALLACIATEGQWPVNPN